jgi:type I restriction enzyme S subunit
MLASRGVSQSNISATKLKGFSIPLPPIFEQQEITRIFTVVDGKIETEERREATLKALFRAMLHQLMTGQTRVRPQEVPNGEDRK